MSRRLISARVAGRAEPKPFAYSHAGDLATVGRRAAVVKIGRFELTGFLGWLFWGVAHIYFLIGLRNRFVVAVTWLWSYLTFRRGARLISMPEDEAARYWIIPLVIDLEQSRIGLLGHVEIIDRDRGVEALRIGHRPLLEREILGVEHQHQFVLAAERLTLLDHDGRENVVGIDADDIGVAQQIDLVGEQEAQRRLPERIEILRREPAIAHHQRGAVGDQLNRTRIVIFEAQLARLLHEQLALGLAAVRADLHEFADRLPHAGEIGADLVDQRALAGVEGGGFARRIAARGDRRGRDHARR